MSENVDLVRSLFMAWERGDFSSAKWAHPEIEYVFADGPAPATWTGLARLAEGFRDYLEAWEEYGVEAEEYRELDVERVIVLYRQSGRGKTSGLDLGKIQANTAMLFHIRNEQVTRIVVYYDRDRALADLGLKE
jgi:ketosteroid isomerase-like protein